MTKLHILFSLIALMLCGNIAAQGTGTQDDPIAVNNLADVKNVDNVGKWYLVDLTGMQVGFEQGNEVNIEDGTTGLIFTKGTMKNLVDMGDKITSGKIKLVCEKHSNSTWVNGANNDIVVVEDIVKEKGTSVAKEVTIEEYAQNWGLYVKVKGKIVSEDNGKGGFNYYFNEAGPRANRIMTNYCGSTIPNVADDGNEYYVSGLLLSDYFRGATFEKATVGSGTEEDPFIVKNIEDVKVVANEGKWYILDLAGKQVTFAQGNEVAIEDETGGLIFTKGEMKNLVSMGDNIISGKVKFVSAKHTSSIWVSNATNIVVEELVKEAGTAVAKVITISEYAQNWGRYVKVKGKIVSEDNGNGGFNYYFNEAGVRANRIALNYCGSTIPALADNDNEYYVSGLLLSDYFRGASFEAPVTISDKQYTTWVTTCDVDFGNEVEAYIATDVTAERVMTQPISNAPAGTPVIVFAENAGEYLLNMIAAEEVTADVTSNRLLASDGNVQGGNNIYALAVKNDVVGFYRVASTVTVPAGKAYIDLTAPKTVSFLPIGGEATGITNVANSNNNSTKKVYHNLSGMRVDNPQKGIYIVNGKKVIF